MANEAYRAVFLRVHPTGKMVLSLTTECRRQGVPVRAARRRRARRPGARREGRAGRHRPLRRRPRLQHEPVRRARRRRSPRDRRRSATRASCSRAWRSSAAPETLTWSNGAWVSGDGGDPTQVKTIEDIALYAHGTGALPPGRRGRPRRAGRLHGLSGGRQRLAVDRDLDLVDDLQRAEQRGVRLDPPVGLLDDGDRAEPAVVVDGDVERDRVRRAAEREVALAR